jgi:hypothetical protein
VTRRWRERAWALSVALLVPAALSVLPLPWTLALCDRWPGAAPSPHTPRALALRVRRWLAQGRGPWAGTCLTRSLVLYVMLRQHGYDPRFFIGVAGARTAFDAHAWVTLAGRPVADPADIPGTYSPLLSHGG